MKRLIIPILALIIAVVVILSIAHDNRDKAFLLEQGISPMPAGYTEEALEQGTLEVLSYNTTMLVTEKKLKRNAMVYLPKGYDPNNRYNILYLIHGRGGDYRTWLGTPDRPRKFKNVLDHMIQDKVIEPTIVIAPGLNYLYGEDELIMEGICNEITSELMPAAESKYSTYASGTDAKAFAASRDHRIVAGFSMGGSATWHIMKDHIDYFRYFIPMSMAMYYDRVGYSEEKSIRASEEISEAIAKSGYEPEDYEVYAATGTEDHKAEATDMQVFDLIDEHVFHFSELGLQKGNITFKIWPGNWHSYTQSYAYLYNALKEFNNGKGFKE